MPASRQRKRCWHCVYRPFYSTRDHSPAVSEIRINGLDQALFDLATTLPMSCFPNDSVHPSARYGEPESKRYRLRKKTHYGTTCCHDMVSLASHIHDPYPGSYCVNNKDLFDVPTPLSTSTISSDWSSNEPATVYAPAGSFDPMPRYGDNSYFAVPVHLGSTSCNTGVFADSLDIMAANQNDLTWNDLGSIGFCSATHREDIQFIENHMSWNPVDPGLPSGLSARTPYEAAAHQPTSSKAAAVPATSDPLPQHPVFPLSVDRLTPECSPNHIENQVDNFLDDLADVINWNNNEPNLEYSSTNDMHTANSVYPSDGMAEQLPATHLDQTEEPDQPIVQPSPDTWSHGLLASTDQFPSI
ncbi:hypothetical protein GJ744_008005 [Endocarpon pusillum]|uniref:Uncharacterized protein n=1 Tax=Endocarpon pusillum TaxID=364733 RepID=A0A8H7E4V1_9EURO|nr:hypothetical protein GJ744_008005 [Endocarpon pusillum]